MNKNMDIFHESSLSLFKKLDDQKKDEADYLEQFQSKLDNIFNDLPKFLDERPRKNNGKKKAPQNKADKEAEQLLLVNETANSEISNNSVASSRPVRSAASKASSSLKEPSLNTKLRQPIKAERVSDNPAADSPVTVISDITIRIVEKENNKNSVNVKREKLSNGSKKKSSDKIIKSEEVETTEQNSEQKLDESVEILQKDDSIIMLTDDEEKIMPPPAMIPPKTAKKKQRNAAKKRQSAASDTSENISIKTEQSSVRSTRTRGKKAQQTAQAKVKVEASTAAAAEVEQTNENEKIAAADLSQESVYEDALTNRVDQQQPRPPPPQSEEDKTVEDVVQEKVEAQQKIIDDTYLAPATIEPCNETFDVAKTGDKTITIAKENNKVKESSMSSIMTEDESFEENIPVISLKKKVMELFNPCVQSPLKKKIEAFEKHAIKQSPAAQAPPPQRQTRTKTRTKLAAKANGDSEIASTTSSSTLNSIKPSTPSANLKVIKPFTPVGQSLTSFLSQSTKRLNAPSASKLPTRSNSANRLPSRDNSVEDAKRGIQALAEEKKKKRDEKLKQVQLQRELKEKEKIEKYKKHMQEKEEKARQDAIKKQKLKDNRDAEAKRKMEELAKIQEQIRIQKQKETEKEAAEQRALKDRERIEAEKEHLKEMLRRNQLAKANRKKSFIFEMLDTDDSTDDEEKTSQKKSDPPAWSLSANRQATIMRQAEISTDIIDSYFCVEPMTINLRTIFPSIDERYLKRNSSAIWNTPPRY